MQQALDRSIHEISGDLGGAGPRFEIVMRDGGVRRVVREQVASLKPDYIAVGTHARTGLVDALLGSVAEDLLADEPVDVSAVKGGVMPVEGTTA